MPTKQFFVFSSVSAILLAIMACALPTNSATGTPTTENSSAKAVADTQTALAAIPSPTNSPLPPSKTPLPLATSTSTSTPTETPLPIGVQPSETPTNTPVTIWAEVMKETSCRIGPGTLYDLVTTFQIGDKPAVAARDLGGGYIVVKSLEKPEEECYILANNVKLSGEIEFLPKYTPLASPTAAPNFTAKFKKFDTCKGEVTAQFIITNTGSVPFRSAYIKVIDLKTNKFAEQVVNAFDQYVGCEIAVNVAPLQAGASGYLSSARFKTDPRGDKMRAIIQVCSEKNLKGTCVTTVVNDIKP